MHGCACVCQSVAVDRWCDSEQVGSGLVIKRVRLSIPCVLAYRPPSTYNIGDEVKQRNKGNATCLVEHVCRSTQFFEKC